ncbi:AIPR family protein [Clostridium butyricum]|uniref:AIPR family protein n=1 Tax=Clostridium butyricum TaxID=1492 RepID=UPI0032C03F3A
MFSKDKKEKIVRMIKEELIKVGIDIQLLTNNSLDDNVDYVLNGNIKLIDSYDLDLNLGDFCMFLFIDKNSYDDTIYLMNSKLEDNFKEESVLPETINIFFIFNTLEDQIHFYESVDKKKLKDSIKKKINIIFKSKNIAISAKNIDYNFLICGDCSEQDFKIDIESRIKALDIKRQIDIDNNKLNIRGYVFTASLYNIVELYNKLGSDLFNYNVRCSIKDELEVDKKIKETLKNDPESFWYLNNGVTMVIDHDNLNLKNSKFIKLHYNNDDIMSIINGAQTVSTSAEYFYNALSEKVDKAKDKAKVMFRIIQVSAEKEMEKGKRKKEYVEIAIQEINKISIALNRQKPIKPEDVAYTVPFIYNINKLRDSNFENKIFFSLVRRGEQNGYDLGIFFRIIKAYLQQQPGQALNEGAKKLLEVKEDEDGEPYFSNGIFEKTVKLYKQEVSEDEFKKYFTPVNFANQLTKEFLNVRKNLIKQIDNEIHKEELPIEERLKLDRKKAIANYGKWYFVAYVIYILNEKSIEDFTNFTATIKEREVELEKIIEVFATLFNELISHLGEKTLTLSNFKNEELYKKLIAYKECNNSELIKKIDEYNEQLKNYFFNE